MVIRDLELFASEEWYSARYTDGDGREYDITLTRSYMLELGYESWELANILSDDEIDNPDSLWEKICAEVARCDLEQPILG